IDNPLNEIDSLMAVLDLEIILQLASYVETKKSLVIAYPKYKYANVQEFNKHHDDHWQLLYNLLDKNSGETLPIPDKVTIQQNFPNPFSAVTTIPFSVPKESAVKIQVFNIKGQLVKELCNEVKKRGSHKIIWDGKNDNDRRVSSGVYFYRLTAGNRTITKKCLLLK
ncbi:MAG: T9SS type A sorting domain-containing protein, partial [Candidatus Cloacimonetes bacterium]|nr:T9SS type A sorting domain-containing protein [Candidatus Cloacimonadota bacterium]